MMSGMGPQTASVGLTGSRGPHHPAASKIWCGDRKLTKAGLPFLCPTHRAHGLLVIKKAFETEIAALTSTLSSDLVV
jgi:hypothetical protein